MKILSDLFEYIKKCCQNFYLMISNKENKKVQLQQSLIQMNELNISTSNYHQYPSSKYQKYKHNIHNNIIQNTLQYTNIKHILISQKYINENNDIEQLNEGAEYYKCLIKYDKNKHIIKQRQKKLVDIKQNNYEIIKQNNYEIIKQNNELMNASIDKKLYIELNQSIRQSNSQSFQTIKSTLSRPISRRNFKLTRQSSKLLSKNKQKQQQFYSVNESQNSSVVNRIKSFEDNYMNEQTTDQMNNWFKSQYQKHIPSSSSSLNYKQLSLSQITKMKLQTKDSFDTMVHKLQDYYTFYYDNQPSDNAISGQIEYLNLSNKQMNKKYSEQNQQKDRIKVPIMNNLSFWYQQLNQELLCSLNKTDYTKSFDYEKTCKYMSLIIIPNCSLSALKFIQWFNQIQVQSILYQFYQIEYIENSQRINQNLILQYPLVKVQQYGQDLNGKQIYTIIRQIQKVRFQNQNSQSLLQTCFQAYNQDKCFQRLIRITYQNNQTTRVQIYTESSENIKKYQYQYQDSLIHNTNNTKLNTNFDTKLNTNYQFQYFQKKWKRFQAKLNKDKVINKKTQQIYAN